MGLVAAVALLVLGYRRYSRISRSEADLRDSRNRANLDLQVMSQQQQVQIITVYNDSVPEPAPSLPPGPPSSNSTDLSMAEQLEVLRSRPAHSWSAHYWAAPKREPKSPFSAPLPAPFPAVATVGIKKRQRQSASAAAPPAKKAYTSPYNEFCLEQRPLLSPGASRQERERRLGELAPLLAIVPCSVCSCPL